MRVPQLVGTGMRPLPDQEGRRQRDQAGQAGADGRRLVAEMLQGFVPELDGVMERIALPG